MAGPVLIGSCTHKGNVTDAEGTVIRKNTAKEQIRENLYLQKEGSSYVFYRKEDRDSSQAGAGQLKPQLLTVMTEKEMGVSIFWWSRFSLPGDEQQFLETLKTNHRTVTSC